MLPLDACGPIARPAGCSMNGRAEQEYEMMVGGLGEKVEGYCSPDYGSLG